MKSQPTRSNSSFIELGAWTRPSSGEEENGDCYLIKSHGDQVVIGVADGLGLTHESFGARSGCFCRDLSTEEARSAR